MRQKSMLISAWSLLFLSSSMHLHVVHEAYIQSVSDNDLDSSHHVTHMSLTLTCSSDMAYATKVNYYSSLNY